MRRSFSLRRRATRIDFFVERHLRARGSLAGKRVVDVPAGIGLMTSVLRELGAEVQPFDLFPELFRAEGIECRKADLSRALPIASSSADLVLCQEGIEHVPNQLGMLRELSRVLKIGGRLLLTTPNVSSLRARASWFLLESDLYGRLPSSELDGVWFAGSGGEPYFGHLFLIGIQRLRILARVAGLRIVALHPVKRSATSICLSVLYPVVAAATAFAYRRTIRRRAAVPREAKAPVLREICRLNLAPAVLFGKHLFLELEKEWEPDAAAERFPHDHAGLVDHLDRQQRLAEEARGARRAGGR